MINPDNITNFDATGEELEEVLLFWICAAGKNASNAARGLDRLLVDLRAYFSPKFSPFELIYKLQMYTTQSLADWLKVSGIGCYNHKARSMWELVNAGLDLRTCSLEDLMSIYGIGPKTARCFLIHSRRNARCAGLDTHILKYLRDKGHDVPKATPGSKKKYEKIERLFLTYVGKNQSVASVDLGIWLYYKDGGGGN